ncbi:MAG TPA: protein-disulfide reductase DsbD domain-containing protein [Mucilaginibacter sp.]
MKRILLAAFALMLTIGANAQIEAPVKWAYAAKKTGANEATIYFKATIDNGWHIYGLDVKDGGPVKTAFTFAKSKDFTPIGKPTQPTPVKKYEAVFKMDVTYFEKSVIFEQKIKLNTKGAINVKGQLEYMTCNDHKCLPPEDVDFSVAVK